MINVEVDQMNIEKDKRGGVGQIPELRRGSLVAALSHLSVREGHWAVDGALGGPGQCTGGT